MSTHTVFWRFSFPTSFRFLPFYSFGSAIQQKRSQFVSLFFTQSYSYWGRYIGLHCLSITCDWVMNTDGSFPLLFTCVTLCTTAYWRSPNLCYPLPSSLRQCLAKVVLQYDCKSIHYYCKIRDSSPHHGTRYPNGAGPPHYRGLTITLRYPTLGRTPLDEWSARRRDLYLTTHNSHKRQTSFSPTGLEPETLASERPQTHAVDRAATWFGKVLLPQFLKYKTDNYQSSPVAKRHLHTKYHRKWAVHNTVLAQCSNRQIFEKSRGQFKMLGLRRETWKSFTQRTHKH
jgi:hypothetical protein